MSSGQTSQGKAAKLPINRPIGKAGYGIDDPRTIIELVAAGILCVIVGLLTAHYTFSTDPRAADTALLVGPSVGFLILVVAVLLFWSSRQGKVREMARIVSNIPWGSGEVVLDLGCGRGLAAVLAAKRLRTGYAVGVDLFSSARVWGNDPRSVLANAAQEKVESRVSALRGSAVRLPLANRSVDVILSGAAVHHLAPRAQREGLFLEMARVLKDGGRIGILDAGNGNEYSAILNKIGMRDIAMHRMRFSGFPPFHVVLARKPYSD